MLLGSPVPENTGMAQSLKAQEKHQATLDRIAGTVLADLTESFAAHREFGEGHGYRDVADWWETQVRFWKLTPEEAEAVKPQFVTDDETAKASDPVLQFVKNYTGTFEFLNSLKAQLVTKGSLSPKQYAAAEKCKVREDEWQAKKAAAASKPKEQSAPVTPVTEGMYRKDGVIYKVQRAVHSSGNLYAKQLIQHGDDWRFEYAPGVIKKLTAEDKMSLDEAKAWGALYGTCCVCGRTLTDEDSIQAGIGPVCATNGF